LKVKQNINQRKRDLYEKNLEVLAKKYPKAIEKIENVKITNKFIIKPTGKKSLPNIYINHEKRFIYEKNDPFEDVKKNILSLELQKTSIIIFLGFGLGYEMLFYGSQLSERLQTQQVLVVEKDVELFKQALEWIDLSIVLENNRVNFIIGEDENNLEEIMKNYLSDVEKLKCLEAVSIIYNPSAFFVDKEYYFQSINVFNQVGTELAQRKGVNIIFEKNMKALREYYPSLAEQIRTLTESGNYRIIKTGTDDISNLWIEDNEILYYGFENPIKDAEQKVEQLKLRNTRVALVLGCGLGYELEVFKNRIAIEQNTVGIIIIEKNIEIFKKALEVTDLTDYICKSKVKMVIGQDVDKFFMEFENYLEKNNDILWLIKALKAVYHPSSLLLDKQYYLQAIREITNASTYMIDYYGNDPEDSFIGVKNMLLNIAEILQNPGINLLKDKFSDKPAIVVSSGPSLNKNKHLLKGLGNKAVIIAADSALRVLTEMGTKPHFVTALERTKPLLKLFENFDKEDTEDVYLAACPVVDPCIYEAYQGPRLIVYRDFAHFKWLGVEKGVLEIKQSAGNMSYKIAEYLGCNPIILIGQDLAYGKDGKTHAVGTTLESDENLQELIRKMGLLEVKGNVDETVLTSKMWYNFLRGYERDLIDYKGVCINCTEGGAYIEGTKVMPFVEAIEKYLKEDINTFDTIKKNTHIITDEVYEEKKKIKNIMYDTIIYMSKVINSCEKGAKVVQNNSDELQNYLASELLTDQKLERINEIENELMNTKKELYQDRKIFQLFFMHIIQPYLIRFEMEMIGIPDQYKDDSLAKIKVLLEHERFFITIKGIAEICVNMLNTTKGNVDI